MGEQRAEAPKKRACRKSAMAEKKKKAYRQKDTVRGQSNLATTKAPTQKKHI